MNEVFDRTHRRPDSYKTILVLVKTLSSLSFKTISHPSLTSPSRPHH